MTKIILISIFALALGLADAALRLDNEPELREAQAALFNVNSNSGWILLNYVDSNTVQFAAGGEGRVDEFKNHLEDDQIQFGVIREESEHGPRDIFIVWIGPQVGRIEKGKKTTHFSDAEQLLQPFHASVTE